MITEPQRDALNQSIFDAGFAAGVQAGRASERQRIRQAVFDNPDHLVGNRRHGESAMSWRQRALHAALEDPDVV